MQYGATGRNGLKCASFLLLTGWSLVRIRPGEPSFSIVRTLKPLPSSRSMLLRSIAILLCSLMFAARAGAATCGGDFNTFLSAMGREAAAAGVSRAVIDSAFAGVTLDGAVLTFDRRQR